MHYRFSAFHRPRTRRPAPPYYLSAQEIAERLEESHELGPGRYLACCPAHDDERPSLSIADGARGRPIFHCFAGCDWRDVSSALQARGLMPSKSWP
jgi:hypothetical protein